jgi:hypothetical protein
MMKIPNPNYFVPTSFGSLELKPIKNLPGRGYRLLPQVVDASRVAADSDRDRLLPSRVAGPRHGG